jgi:hypothetical protein
MITIPSLGPLSVSEDIEEWLISEPIAVPYFDGLGMTFTLDGFTEESEDEEEIEIDPEVEKAIEKAVRAFLSLGAKDREAAGESVFQYFRKIVDALGEDQVDVEIASAEEVWEYVEPIEIFVTPGYDDDNAICIVIMAECDWDPEHGLQLVYRNGNEFVGVGEQD